MKLILSVVLLCLYFAYNECVIVNTTDGLLNGNTHVSRSGRIYEQFLGIPFAEKPIGDLRFMDPVPKKKWQGIRDATKYGNPCLQLYDALIGSEDCLYLSVYTPKVNQSKLNPVLFYIHEGGYKTGSSQGFKTPEYIMDHNVTLVMTNYRLGALGFLSLNDHVISGNMGLKDQVLALKWVKRNIISFSGDPNRITVYGESVGAASAHLFMFSPMSRDLFQQAISISGTALSPPRWKTPEYALNAALTAAKMLHCPLENSTEILRCLRCRCAESLVALPKRAEIWPNTKLSLFTPTSDPNARDPFLPGNPHTLTPASKPWMASVSELDGVIDASAFINTDDNFKVLDYNFKFFIPQLLGFEETACNPADIACKIKKFYFGTEPITPTQRRTLLHMIGDNREAWPLVDSLNKHNGDEYIFYTTYVGNYSLQSIYGATKPVNGTVHIDETIYIWKLHEPIIDIPDLTGQDLQFSKDLIQLLINFVTYGNPTATGFNFSWPVWGEKRNYVRLGNDGFNIETNLLSDRMNFWSNLPFRNKADQGNEACLNN